MPESGAKYPPLIGVDPTELADPVGKFDKSLTGSRSDYLGRVER
jgi:hypothetical protein